MEGFKYPTLTEERNLAVMFVDLKGSNKLVSSLSGKELKERLEQWFDVICGTFRAYGGDVKDKPGDCAVVAWSELDSYAAERALLAAKRAHLASKNLEFETHIGIHWDKGELLPKPEIEPYMTDLPSLFGKASWIAARVQGKDKEGRILASKEFIQVLSIPAVWTPRPDLELKEFGRYWNLFHLSGVGTPQFQNIYESPLNSLFPSLGLSITLIEISM